MRSARAAVVLAALAACVIPDGARGEPAVEGGLDGLEAMIVRLEECLGEAYPHAPRHLARLAQLRQQGIERKADGASRDRWMAEVAELRRRALVLDNPLFDFDKLLFVKRFTYDANHYYTEYVNSKWLPGGNLCVLDLKDGSVREVVRGLEGGVFGRFDLSFDGRRLVFAWKPSHQEGYRIHEVRVDGSGLRQLTFPQDDEAELVRRYRVRAHYHHGTDDMQPCYLPDGHVMFISTRCQYGILCDGPDDFTTTVLYRMDPDGGSLRKLTNSSVSEASPVVLPDGRVMYTRWEYLDKGAVSVKCLWAMRPDGTASSEIYGNTLSLPPTLIYGRPIPNAALPNQYVMLGTPHYPQNGVGTVIRMDGNREKRNSRDPMTYMTPDVDIQAEAGFAFRNPDGSWRRDGAGRGRLFRDPYPLSENFFLVAHKPEGPAWTDPKAYGLYLLDDRGNVQLLYDDPEISCWLPYPLKARSAPPVLASPLDAHLAARGLAHCIVGDVHHGLEDVPRGTIRHLRVLEQVPRPWAARRRWGGDEFDQQHAAITKYTHLGLKVQHGVVPVEEDGSASFLVPAEANIFFQALDANYMAVQTERTYVNYMPGETRSCIGCHESGGDAPVGPAAGTPMAMRRPPSVPGPQPGESRGQRPLDYVLDVQPVWDRHCVECHSGPEPEAGLDLSGTPTAMFNASYESLVPERRRDGTDRRLLGLVIGENHPKTGNVHYLPARSLGSHASVLAAMLRPGSVQRTVGPKRGTGTLHLESVSDTRHDIREPVPVFGQTLSDPAQAERAAKLAVVHREIRLRPEELLKITNWIDTNCQYYGSYWGRRNLKYTDHPNFRPQPTFETATSMTSPIPEEER